MSTRKRLTPYQRIIRAAQCGKGVRLSAAEVRDMSADHAIMQVAEHDDGGEGIEYLLIRLSRPEEYPRDVNTVSWT